MSNARGAQGSVVLRESNRWLLLVYDTLMMVVVWLVCVANKLSAVANLAHLGLAFACYTGARLAFKVYRVVLRGGSIGAYLREIAALIVGGGCCYALFQFVPALWVSKEFLMRFVLLYALASLFIRVAYFCLYRLAKLDNPVSRRLRKVMTALTLVDFDSEGGVMRVVLAPAEHHMSPINQVQNVVAQFAIRGEATDITQINRGYINQTYRVETLSDTGHVHKYALQRINTNVFPDVDALMDNFKLTTDHLHGKLTLPGHSKKGAVQMLRPTKDGRAYLRDDSGCWRMVTFFDGVYSLDIPDSPQTFYQAGRAFGQFVKEMSDVPLEDVRVVIPNFHNTRSRYEDLERVIAKDPRNRLKDVGPEVAFVRARADCYGIITDALESGRIPTRICHNDCNLHNILFDNDTHLPVAIIDLDTVMPSSPLYDYGDSMRIGTNTATDDEKDLSKVSCDLGLYEQYARGYLEACGDMLTEEELKLLPYASLVITSEDGIRFLMDHIDGDTYYNIYYPGQNLDRSRTQLKLVEDMERKLPRIVKILQGIYDSLNLGVKLDEAEIVKGWRAKEPA